ncbi:excisionase family DNA-binding protein [Methylorubrum extorquens]
MRRTPREDLLEALSNLTVDFPTACRLVGTGRSAGYRAIQDGTLPAFRIGKVYRIRTDELLKKLGIEGPDAREAALARVREELSADPPPTRPLRGRPPKNDDASAPAA